MPVELDYSMVETALSEQVFTGPDGSAEFSADARNCISIRLSDPDVQGSDAGQLHFISGVEASMGFAVGGKCRLGTKWQGQLQTIHTAEIDADTAVVAFPIVDSLVEGDKPANPVLMKLLQQTVREFVLPSLAAVTIDFSPALTGLDEVLQAMLAAGTEVDESAILGPSKLAEIRPEETTLVAVLALQVPDAPPGWAPAVEAPLTDAELAEWDAAWQAWDAFATWTIKTLAVGASPELTRALVDVLLDARYELRAALERDEFERDPVRELFLSTWTRLAPLVQEVQLNLPGSQALSYTAFISAGNALQVLDQLAPHLGGRLDSSALRTLSRTLEPSVTEEALVFSTSVDSELRHLLGFAPELELEPDLEPEAEPDAEAETMPNAAAWLLSLVMQSAYAAEVSTKLVEQLEGWVPKLAEVDQYLSVMAELLDGIAEAEYKKGKVPEEYRDLHDTLLRATAWQESCWRHWVKSQGEVQTISSGAGSVGLMQINVHVWRGVYDIDSLYNDVLYNARAGNEILVHYLVDYGIRKGEHQITDPTDALARATYAVYNSGPRHLTRYRNPETSASLQKIDRLFWDKYQAIQSDGPSAVKRCFTGQESAD